ncbi:MAG: acetate kinase [Planctomycetaceae bacterium]|nr:acetate kinase [Planctomycetaceae bacterium]
MTAASILVVNAGSSSVKFAIFDFATLQPTATALLDWRGNSRQASLTLSVPDRESACHHLDVLDYRSGVAEGLSILRRSSDDAKGTDFAIRVVGHRLIHGGQEIREPVRINAAMKMTIARFARLAPLHIPPGIEAIEATETALPDADQIGVFDTAFFAHIPPAAYLYPLPYQWYEQWGIRRFGYHGTSHAYCAERATELIGHDSGELRLIICHLGQGASATAVRGGVAMTNSMGLTPLEGLMMGTRSGTIDPGILIHVQREHGLTVDELDEVLHHRSGLLGLSGVSSDFRKVEDAATGGHSRAQLALDVYAHRVREQIGALTVSLGGLDALVFTGGIGENSTWLRREVCRGLECLEVHLDDDRNETCQPDCDVATCDSQARILVIHTREDLMIARQTRQLITDGAR